MIDADFLAGELQRPVHQPGPMLPHGLDLIRSGQLVIEHSRFSAETLRPQRPGRHQHVRMMVPVVTVTVRLVYCPIDGHPITR